MAVADPPSPRLEILSEPLTYQATLRRDRSGLRGIRAASIGEPVSYVKDLVLWETRQGSFEEAGERLRRHAREMEVTSLRREAAFAPGANYQTEQRAVNWTNGQGGYFAPPLWIVEQFAMQPTPERVLASLAPCFDLPVGCQSVNLPGWTTGPDVAAIGVGSSGANTDIVDQAITSAVATIAGNEDVPLQMLEQSPVGAHLDWAVFTAMEARYGYKLEQQLLIGNGAATPQGSGNDQLLGLFNNTQIPTGNKVEFANSGASAEVAPGTASTGATDMYGYVGFLISKIGQTRLLPPEAFMMSSSRLGWMGSSEDKNNRPLILADRDESTLFDLITVTTYLNDAIPRNLGVGTNEDRIICCRPSDWLILESERRTSVMLDVLSGTLQARLQSRRYVAALLRQPTSVSWLYGAGMATGGGW